MRPGCHSVVWITGLSVGGKEPLCVCVWESEQEDVYLRTVRKPELLPAMHLCLKCMRAAAELPAYTHPLNTQQQTVTATGF